MSQQEIPKWRWQLVDSLAHGRKFWPMKITLSDPKSEGSLVMELENAKQSGDLERMKKAVTDGRERLNMMVQSLPDDAARTVLITPRFDISDAVFIKDEVPYDQWNEYIHSLPALCVPFAEFWMTWAWASEDRTRKTEFASKLLHRKTEAGSTLGIETYVDLPAKDNLTNQEELVLRIDGELDLDDRMMASAIRTNDSDIILFIPLLHSLALLGCRNVKTVEVVPPRQIRRRTMQTHGVALCSYRLVVIGNKNNKKRSQSDDKGGHRGISICRGHFKTYDERGLFGNRKGTWWWQSQARGGYEAGVVVRDYVLNRKEVPAFTGDRD